MKNLIVLICLLFSISNFADDKDEKDKNPEAKLKLSDHNCVSPCPITLDGSKSEPSKSKVITKYIFDIGNGDIIESTTPKIEYIYINYVKDSDTKHKHFQKSTKYHHWIKKKFKGMDVFKPTLKVIDSANLTSKEEQKTLVVKASSILPTVDGDDILPPKPNQIENDSTLLGTDLDGDLVRDDIEYWIKNNIANINQRRALKQISKRMQEGLSVVDDKPASIQATIKSLKALGCLRAVMGQDLRAVLKLMKTLQVEFYNTKDRLIAEDKKSQNYNGATKATYDPTAEEDRLKCEFTLE